MENKSRVIDVYCRACDSRKYTYFFPTYLLIPPKPGGKLHQALHQQATSDIPASPGQAPSDDIHSFWSETEDMLSTREDDLRRKRRWRIDNDLVTLLRESAKKFEGTHNFHNFTVGRDFGDRSSQRHMKKIEVIIISWTILAQAHDWLPLQISDPAVYGDTEWMSVILHGQSFMLHQVRSASLAWLLIFTWYARL